MSFTAESGLIEVTDGAGNLRLSSDVDMLHIVNSGINGSRTFPQVTLSNGQQVNTTTDYLVGTCHPSCDLVLGAVNFTAASQTGHGFRLNTWCSYSGGDMVWAMTAQGLTQSTASWRLDSVALAALYRFYISGGNIYLRRRLAIVGPPGDDTVLQHLAHTLSWRLKAALFS